eukprot:COSAG01_NODE_6301_length_3747_cov_6.773849_2_plen_118_part_00
MRKIGKHTNRDQTVRNQNRNIKMMWATRYSRYITVGRGAGGPWVLGGDSRGLAPRACCRPAHGPTEGATAAEWGGGGARRACEGGGGGGAMAPGAGAAAQRNREKTPICPDLGLTWG